MSSSRWSRQRLMARSVQPLRPQAMHPSTRTSRLRWRRRRPSTTRAGSADEAAASLRHLVVLTTVRVRPGGQPLAQTLAALGLLGGKVVLFGRILAEVVQLLAAFAKVERV